MTRRDHRTIQEISQLLEQARGTRLQSLVRELGSDERAGVRSAVARAEAAERARRHERARLRRLYALQEQLAAEGLIVVVGIDEVGRGALAGPLSAGACVLPLRPRLEGLNDSKQLTPAQREKLAHRITQVAPYWSVAHVSPAEVDSLGMTAALRRVMTKAIDGLGVEVDHVVLDGRPLHLVEYETAVVGADGKVAAVAAASVLAKVNRDALMVSLAAAHASYRFDVNKGYATPEHLKALDAHGPCEVHRSSFIPCQRALRLF